MKVRDFFEEVEKELNSCPLIISVDFFTESVDLYEGYYKAKAKFMDGSELHLFEYVELEAGSDDKYRYHYQTKDGETVFRWDNAGHHEEVDTFPDHFHEDGRVKESEKPSVSEVLRRVIEEVES